MEIVNRTGSDQYLPCTGEVVEDGATAKVSKPDADSLIEQGTGWVPKNKPTTTTKEQ